MHVSVNWFCLSEHKSSWQLKWLFSSLSRLFWLLVLTSGPLASVNVTTSMIVSVFCFLHIICYASESSISVCFLFFTWWLIFPFLFGRLLCILVLPMFRLHHSQGSWRVSLPASVGQFWPRPTHHHGHESVCPTHLWDWGNDFWLHCKKRKTIYLFFMFSSKNRISINL